MPGGPQAASDRPLAAFLDAARCCGARLEADTVGIFELVDGGTSLRTVIAPTTPKSDSAPPATTLIPAEASMAAYALTTGNAAISPDLEAEQRFDDSFLRQQGIRSGLVFPVWLDDQPVCLLGMFRSTPHDFTLDEVYYVEQVGEALARLAKVASWHPSTDPSATTISKEDCLRRWKRCKAVLRRAS